jgi:hypothetical protein
MNQILAASQETELRAETEISQGQTTPAMTGTADDRTEASQEIGTHRDRAEETMTGNRTTNNETDQMYVKYCHTY